MCERVPMKVYVAVCVPGSTFGCPMCACVSGACVSAEKKSERERESEFLVPQERTNKGRAFNNNGTKFEKDVQSQIEGERVVRRGRERGRRRERR